MSDQTHIIDAQTRAMRTEHLLEILLQHTSEVQTKALAATILFLVQDLQGDLNAHERSGDADSPAPVTVRFVDSRWPSATWTQEIDFTPTVGRAVWLEDAEGERFRHRITGVNGLPSGLLECTVEFPVTPDVRSLGEQ